MKRIVSLLFTVLCCLSLSGCMGAVPIDRRLLVQAMGIDWTGEEYQVYLQAFAPSDGGSEEGKTELWTGSGENLTGCLEEIGLDTGRELFFGSCRVVLVNSRAAEERTGEVIDCLLSDHELRPGTPLALTGESSALVLGTEPMVAAQQMGEILEAAWQAGKCPESTLLSVVRSLESQGKAAALAWLEPTESGLPSASGAALLGGETAVFLTPEEWQGIGYLTGDSRRVSYLLDYRGGQLLVELSPTQSRLTGGETPGTLDYTLHAECVVREYSGGMLAWDSAEIQAVQAVAEQAVRRDVQRGFSALQQADRDVICALETVQKFQPEYCAGRAPEELFGSLRLETEIEVNLTALGAGAQASA